VKRGRVVIPLAACALLVFLAGCGAKEDQALGDRIAGQTLTIYSSMPLSGVTSLSGQTVLAGEQLALRQAGGRIGKYRIRLESLNDATAQRGEWDPGQTTLNADQAIQDKSTIGYIGELNSGASAVSIPLLNRPGIPQISPASTAVGLTVNGAGAAPGEPQKYYPTGRRTFARVVPNDQVQAAAMVKLQQGLGCKKVYVLEDGEVDGEDTATTFELEAKGSSLNVVAIQLFDPKATDYRSLAQSVAQTGANCVLISAISDTHAALLSQQIAAAAPGATVFGSAGLADSKYADPVLGGIPLTLDPRVLIVVATLSPITYPPAARAFYGAFTRHYGAAQPDAIFGYEAMSLMLNAIDRATDHGRRAPLRSKVLAAIFATRNRHSVLGTYSIDRDGDTTLNQYGVWRVADGGLQFWKAITS
jgi:branched-chain amino acid transport system substrate-binding protein